MTGKAKFEQEVIAVIERENRRRKIGKAYVLAHVVQIVNRLGDGAPYRKANTEV